MFDSHIKTIFFRRNCHNLQIHKQTLSRDTDIVFKVVMRFTSQQRKKNRGCENVSFSHKKIKAQGLNQRNGQLIPIILSLRISIVCIKLSANLKREPFFFGGRKGSTIRRFLKLKRNHLFTALGYENSEQVKKIVRRF